MKATRAMSAVEKKRACEHGGAAVEEVRRGILDFSANLNPYGPPAFSASAVEEAMDELGIYPDRDANALKALIAAKLKRGTDEITVTAGISELIYLIFIAFSPRRVVIPEYTYCEYERVAEIFGVRVEKVSMAALRINAESVACMMKSGDVVFLCNPNNPTGQYLGSEEMKTLVDAAEDANALLVVDEAYIDFVQKPAKLHTVHSQNLIIMRSFTKSYGIPGVRLGYAVGSEERISALNAVKPPWNVDVFAQKIGIAAMKNENFLRETIPKVRRSKEKMERALSVRSDANFFLFDTSRITRITRITDTAGTADATGGRWRTAREVREALLRRGILVRDCTSFGLPSHIRFCVRRDEENEMLVSAILQMIER